MAAREAFIDGQGALDAAKLVFVDESGVITGMNRLYGWAPSGATPMITRSTRGKRLNIVGAIAHDGPRCMMTYEGSMNEARFLAYISAHLGPSLKKGDVVVLDGFSVHKMKSVAVAIATYGSSVLILPPYSPELNPIEHTWSTLKARLRSIGAGTWSELVRLTDEVWNGLPAKFFPDWVWSRYLELRCCPLKENTASGAPFGGGFLSDTSPRHPTHDYLLCPEGTPRQIVPGPTRPGPHPNMREEQLRGRPIFNPPSSMYREPRSLGELYDRVASSVLPSSSGFALPSQRGVDTSNPPSSRRSVCSVGDSDSASVASRRSNPTLGQRASSSACRPA